MRIPSPMGALDLGAGEGEVGSMNGAGELERENELRMGVEAFLRLKNDFFSAGFLVDFLVAPQKV
jgi:hypothetical protein